VRHQHGSRVVHYRFNPLHLRGGPVGPGGRVLVLGDSFVFGWLLDEDDTLVRVLGDRVDREFGAGTWTLLNGGVDGWGTANQAAFLETWGPRIQPQIVLVFLGVADVERSARSGLYALTSTQDPELEARGRSVGGLRRVLDRLPGYRLLLEHSHLVQLAHRVALAHGLLGRPPGWPPEGEKVTDVRGAVRLTRALFRRMHSWCEAHGAELWVATTGFHPWLAERLSASDAAFYAEASEFFAKAGIPFVDLGPEVTAAAPFPDAFTLIGGRPNADGVRLMARATWTWLRSLLTARSPGSEGSASPPPV